MSVSPKRDLLCLIRRERDGDWRVRVQVDVWPAKRDAGMPDVSLATHPDLSYALIIALSAASASAGEHVEYEIEPTPRVPVGLELSPN